MPRPTPLVAPVTTATLPSRFMSVTVSGLGADVLEKWSNATVRGSPPRRPALLAALLVQKSEHVISPDGEPKIAKDMALLSGLAIGRINLQLVRFARLFHCC